MSGLIGLLISLIVLGVVLSICWWILSMIPAPPPIATVIRVVFALVCLLAVLSLLMGGWAFPVAGYGRSVLR
jgi:hypothetical protein